VNRRVTRGYSCVTIQNRTQHQQPTPDTSVIQSTCCHLNQMTSLSSFGDRLLLINAVSGRATAFANFHVNTRLKCRQHRQNIATRAVRRPTVYLQCRRQESQRPRSDHAAARGAASLNPPSNERARGSDCGCRSIERAPLAARTRLFCGGGALKTFWPPSPLSSLHST
jgi:hypothetical protein